MKISCLVTKVSLGDKRLLHGKEPTVLLDSAAARLVKIAKRVVTPRYLGNRSSKRCWGSVSHRFGENRDKASGVFFSVAENNIKKAMESFAFPEKINSISTEIPQKCSRLLFFSLES